MKDITRIPKITICELVAAGIAMTDDPDVIKIFAKIQERAEAMEERLSKYCNTIESLGFTRVGRDYDDL